jgi:hypothetical protein
MDNYFVKLKRGKVTHNIPQQMPLDEFRFIMGSVVGHLIDNLGDKTFHIDIERDHEGKACGSYCK